MKPSFQVQLNAAIGALKQGDIKTYNGFAAKVLFESNIFDVIDSLQAKLKVLRSKLAEGRSFPSSEGPRVATELEEGLKLCSKVRSSAIKVAELLE